MRISKVNLINNPKYNINSKNQISTPVKTSPKPIGQYSAENVRANFLPAFGGYKKVGSTLVMHRDTGIPVPADIRKETIGPYSMFSLMINRKEAGFLTMNCDSIYPSAEDVLKLPTDNIPQVTHLRTIDGEKYAGIGTALIKTAIQESYNNGSYGNLWLTAEKGYEKNLSPYRSDENPIPFYYKIGFKSPDKETDSYIKKCIKSKSYFDLPNSANLLLTQEAKDKWIKNLCQNPIMKFKKYPIAS